MHNIAVILSLNLSLNLNLNLNLNLHLNLNLNLFKKSSGFRCAPEFSLPWPCILRLPGFPVHLNLF